MKDGPCCWRSMGTTSLNISRSIVSLYKEFSVLLLARLNTRWSTTKLTWLLDLDLLLGLGLCLGPIVENQQLNLRQDQRCFEKKRKERQAAMNCKVDGIGGYSMNCEKKWCPTARLLRDEDNDETKRTREGELTQRWNVSTSLDPEQTQMSRLCVSLKIFFA